MRHTAPEYRAGPQGRPLAWHNLFTNSRMKSVCADQTRPGCGTAIVKLKCDVRFSLRKTRRAFACLHAVRSCAFHKCCNQHHLKFATVDRELRPVISSGPPTRLCPDFAPPLGVESQGFCCDADCLQLLFETQIKKLPHCIGLQIDPHTKRLELSHSFVNSKGNSNLVQCQTQCQPANPRARDQDCHVNAPDARMADTSVSE